MHISKSCLVSDNIIYDLYKLFKMNSIQNESMFIEYIFFFKKKSKEIPLSCDLYNIKKNLDLLQTCSIL